MLTLAWRLTLGRARVGYSIHLLVSAETAVDLLKDRDAHVAADADAVEWDGGDRGVEGLGLQYELIDRRAAALDEHLDPVRLRLVRDQIVLEPAVGKEERGEGGGGGGGRRDRGTTPALHQEGPGNAKSERTVDSRE